MSHEEFATNFYLNRDTKRIIWLGKQKDLLAIMKIMVNKQIIATGSRTTSKIILDHFFKDKYIKRNIKSIEETLPDVKDSENLYSSYYLILKNLKN